MSRWLRSAVKDGSQVAGGRTRPPRRDPARVSRPRRGGDPLIAEGDLVAPYKTFTGTDTGDVFGSRRREARHDPCMDFVRYRDGLVAEHWNVVDTSNVATA